MVGAIGFEPTTYGTQKRSNTNIDTNASYNINEIKLNSSYTQYAISAFLS